MPAEALAQLLMDNEQVSDLLKQSADEMSLATTIVNQAFASSNLGLGVERALAKQISVAQGLRELSKTLSVSNHRLARAVRQGVMANHQLAAAVEQEQGARAAALHDRLTGLPNRALFNDRLEHGIAQATPHQGTLAVMFLDLNKFKRINDTHGHDVGDAVLKIIARRLTEITRVEDTVSRHGGDEFLYLLTQVKEAEDFAKIAGKILLSIREPCAVKARGEAVKLSIEASIGIAIFPNDGATAAELIRSADGAMYRAKNQQSGYVFAQQASAQIVCGSRQTD